MTSLNSICLCYIIFLIMIVSPTFSLEPPSRKPDPVFYYLTKNRVNVFGSTALNFNHLYYNSSKYTTGLNIHSDITDCLKLYPESHSLYNTSRFYKGLSWFIYAGAAGGMGALAVQYYLLVKSQAKLGDQGKLVFLSQFGGILGVGLLGGFFDNLSQSYLFQSITEYNNFDIYYFSKNNPIYPYAQMNILRSKIGLGDIVSFQGEEYYNFLFVNSSIANELKQYSRSERMLNRHNWTKVAADLTTVAGVSLGTYAVLNQSSFEDIDIKLFDVPFGNFESVNYTATAEQQFLQYAVISVLTSSFGYWINLKATEYFRKSIYHFNRHRLTVLKTKLIRKNKKTHIPEYFK